MNLDFIGQIDLGGAAQSLPQNCPLDLQLMFVAGVLVMTSTARSEIGAWWRDSVGRRFYDALGLRPGKSRLLLDNRSFHLFTAQNKR